jgi:hypothetical protein
VPPTETVAMDVFMAASLFRHPVMKQRAAAWQEVWPAVMAGAGTIGGITS